MESIRPLTERSIPASGVICMALAHNEARRAADFLRHHRNLGVRHFLVVDDRSDDGTTAYLGSQDDVTLFAPDGTNYRDHKVLWRKDVLDRYAGGRWVLVPDFDELFVYPHCDAVTLDRLTTHLDREGSEAVFAPMVEMYTDAPPADRLYVPDSSLLATYPYFDADGYRLLRPSSNHLRQYPTPPLDLYGGPRERVFRDFTPGRLSPSLRWMLERFANLSRSLSPGVLERAVNLLARAALARVTPRPPLVMSKLALVKWRSGRHFSGGPHSISERLPLSPIWGALLHFKFMDIEREAAYHVARGQHAKGSIHYRQLLAHGRVHRSLRYPGSRKYESWRDLLACGLLRTSSAWDAEVAGLRSSA